MLSIASLTNHKGFTLAEIIIAMAILALLVQFAVHNFLPYLPTLRLHGATQQVVWNLRAARMQAINQHQNIIVAFTNSHQYTIGPDLNHNGALDSGEGKTRDLRGQYHHITFIDPLPPALTFNPKGVSNISPIITLTNTRALAHIKITLVGNISIN